MGASQKSLDELCRMSGGCFYLTIRDDDSRCMGHNSLEDRVEDCTVFFYHRPFLKDVTNRNLCLDRSNDNDIQTFTMYGCNGDTTSYNQAFYIVDDGKQICSTATQTECYATMPFER